MVWAQEPRIKCSFVEGDIRTIRTDTSHTLSPLFLGNVDQILRFKWTCMINNQKECWGPSTQFNEKQIEIPANWMEADKIYTYTMQYSYLGLNGDSMTDTCSTLLQTKTSALEL